MVMVVGSVYYEVSHATVYDKSSDPRLHEVTLTKKRGGWCYWRRVATGEESHTNGRGMCRLHPLDAWLAYYRRELTKVVLYAEIARDNRRGYAFYEIEAATRRALLAFERISDVQRRA